MRRTQASRRHEQRYTRVGERVGSLAAYGQVKEPRGEKPSNSIRTLSATDQNVAERKRTKLYVACCASGLDTQTMCSAWSSTRQSLKEYENLAGRLNAKSN